MPPNSINCIGKHRTLPSLLTVPSLAKVHPCKVGSGNWQRRSGISPPGLVFQIFLKKCREILRILKEKSKTQVGAHSSLQEEYVVHIIKYLRQEPNKYLMIFFHQSPGWTHTGFPVGLFGTATATISSATLDKKTARKENNVGDLQLLPQVDRIVPWSAAVTFHILIQPVQVNWNGKTNNQDSCHW